LVVIDTNSVNFTVRRSTEEWMRDNNASLVQRFSVQIHAREEGHDWLLVKLNP
jgi:hypothetical protein